MAGEQWTDDALADWYADYLRNVSASDWAQRYKRRSFDLIGVRSGARVIDIGCGLGADIRAIGAIVGPTGRAVGVDRDPKMIERAGDMERPVELACADAVQLPYADGSFDGARMDRVLQHSGKADVAIAEMRRVLRADGRAVCIEPDWGTYAVDLPDRALLRRVLDARADAFADGWIGRGLYRLFREAGFIDIRVDPFNAVMTDFAAAAKSVDLAHAHVIGIARGGVDDREAQRWQELIARASEAPTFFSAITFFMVSGTR